MRCFLLLLLACFLAGCTCTDPNHDGFGPVCSSSEFAGGDSGSSFSGDTSTGAAGTGTGQTGGGILHVSNSNGRLIRFTAVSTRDGDEASTTPVTGSTTRLNSPQHLYLEAADNRLYVPDSAANAILVFESASAIEGDAPPARVLTGGNTELSAPTSVVRDAETDELYVCCSGSATVLVFANASVIDGDVAPSRRISGPNSNLAGARTLLLTSNQLVVGTANSIRVFDTARSQNGDPFPARIISGGNTRISGVRSLLLDSGDNLYVADGNNAILRFATFSTLEGDVVPASVVQGSNTMISSPGQMVFDGAGGIYLANGNSILFFEAISAAEGNPIPERRITGNNTNLSGAVGLALDNTR